MENQLTSQITIETLPAMRVACYRWVSPSPEMDGGAFMDAWVAQQNLGARARNFGFDCDVTEEQAKAGLRSYEQWRVVPESVGESEGVTIQFFPGGLYAVMTLYRPFEAPFERIPAGWQQLMDWVKASEEYLPANHQWLEELIPGNSGEDLKLYHPVTKK